MNHRPSILKRPLKPMPISANTENLDKEYTEEQVQPNINSADMVSTLVDISVAAGAVLDFQE
jgi:hypothetical protein